MSNRRKTAKLAPWIPMDRHQHKSAAFAALSAEAQALLVHLTYNYNTRMMNCVWISARDAAKKLNVGKTCAAKALLELEHYGFIVKVQGAYLGVSGVGKSAHYRLTAQRYGNLGATHDYDKWDGEIFEPAKHPMTEADKERLRKKQNPVRRQGHTVRREGHKDGSRKPAKMEQVSAGRDIRNQPDCPPGGTYLVLPSARETRAPEHAPIGHNAGPPLQPEITGLKAWTTPTLIELEWNDYWQRYYCEVVEATARTA
jgi:hypothetical protein